MKKCSLISKFYLTAAVLIAILFTGCDADTPENIPEDTIDGNSNNYCSVITFMDFESENWDTKPFPPEGDSAVIETVKGAGIGGSDCIKVTQNGPYGRTVINLKKYFNIHIFILNIKHFPFVSFSIILRRYPQNIAHILLTFNT